VKRILVVVAVLALAAFAVWLVATDRAAPVGGGTDVGGDTAPAAGGGIPVPAGADEMVVVDVTDGDTLRLRDASGVTESVRLIGLDTPEVYPVYECFGDEAEAELRRLAPIGSTLRVATDDDPFDDYDRLLLYLWNDDDVFVNLALVEGGFAEAIRVQPNDLHFDALRAAEDAAATAGLGMWSC
jgi:micrococcal nuclease